MSVTKPTPRLDIASLLEALEANEANEETDSSTSSPLSYRSNGHDGLTDVDSDSDSFDACDGGAFTMRGLIPALRIDPTPRQLVAVDTQTLTAGNERVADEPMFESSKGLTRLEAHHILAREPADI